MKKKPWSPAGSSGNDLSLDLFSTFIAFAEAENIVEAARRLRLSQPAVSLQLKRLEQALPHPVFSFEGKRKVLTHYGRALHAELKDKISAVGDSIERVNRFYGAPESIRLKVGARSEILPRIAQGLKFPGRVHYVALTGGEALSRLLAHQIDIAVTHEKPDLTGIIARKLFSNGVRVAAHRRWAGKGGSFADPEFLLRTPFLAYKEEPPFLAEWARHCKVDPARVTIRSICEDWNTIVRLIGEGEGYSLIPSDIPIDAGAGKIVTHDVPSSVIPEVTFYAIYHADLAGIAAIWEHLKFPGSMK